VVRASILGRPGTSAEQRTNWAYLWTLLQRQRYGPAVTLYKALATVLGDDALRAAELADRVNQSGLYRRRDSRPVPAYQVASTVHAYRDLFDVHDGMITLRPVAVVRSPDEDEAPRAGQGEVLPGDRITRGIAGEHFVCGELAKRGWIATLTAKNTPRHRRARTPHRFRTAARPDPSQDAFHGIPARLARRARRSAACLRVLRTRRPW
jgi:hypothetical protein